MNKLWVISWKNPATKSRDKVSTPYLPTEEAALAWFLAQKPYMQNHLETVRIMPWSR